MQRSWFPAHKRWQGALSAVSSGFVGRMETNPRGDPGRLTQCVCVTTQPSTEHPKAPGFPAHLCVPEQLLLPCGAVWFGVCGHRGSHPAPNNCPAFGQHPTGHSLCLRDCICAFGNTKLSICVQLGRFPALSPSAARGAPGAGLWRSREVSQYFQDEMRQSCCCTAHVCSSPKKPFSMPWAACLIPGFVKHSSVPGVLWFGPGGVKGH